MVINVESLVVLPILNQQRNRLRIIHGIRHRMPQHASKKIARPLTATIFVFGAKFPWPYTQVNPILPTQSIISPVSFAESPSE